MTESQEVTEDPLRSVHTSNFPELLRELSASVLVTTGADTNGSTLIRVRVRRVRPGVLMLSEEKV